MIYDLSIAKIAITLNVLELAISLLQASADLLVTTRPYMTRWYHRSFRSLLCYNHWTGDVLFFCRDDRQSRRDRELVQRCSVSVDVPTGALSRSRRAAAKLVTSPPPPFCASCRRGAPHVDRSLAELQLRTKPKLELLTSLFSLYSQQTENDWRFV